MCPLFFLFVTRESVNFPLPVHLAHTIEREKVVARWFAES